MRKWLILLVFVVATAAGAEEAESYKQSLIRQFPFYNVAHGIFAPVYPAFARQLVADYGLTKGVCVDVGGAEGSLAIALARLTELTVYVADLSPAAVRLCNLSADEEHLTGRVRAVEADAQALPFRDNFADLVVSRNSIFEWPDKLAGISEAYRILKPGGVALLGGGFSRLMAPDDLSRLVDWSAQKRAQKPNDWVEMDKGLVGQARAAGVAHIRLIEGPTAFDWWLEIRRQYRRRSSRRRVVVRTRQPDPHIKLSNTDRDVLEAMSHQCDGKSPQARRACLLLLAAEGWSNREICEALGCTSQTVTCWRRRWAQAGLKGVPHAHEALHRQSGSIAWPPRN